MAMFGDVFGCHNWWWLGVVDANGIWCVETRYVAKHPTADRTAPFQQRIRNITILRLGEHKIATMITIWIFQFPRHFLCYIPSSGSNLFFPLWSLHFNPRPPWSAPMNLFPIGFCLCPSRPAASSGCKLLKGRPNLNARNSAQIALRPPPLLYLQTVVWFGRGRFGQRAAQPARPQYPSRPALPASARGRAQPG